MRKLRSLESVSHNYDLGNLIRVVYNTMEIVDDGQKTGILFGDSMELGTFIPCDKPIVKLARTIIQLAVSKNEEIYTAFYETFQNLVKVGLISGEVKHITVESVIKAFDYELKGESLYKDINTAIVGIMKDERSV